VGRKGNSSRTCGACYSTRGLAERVIQRVGALNVPEMSPRRARASGAFGVKKIVAVLWSGTWRELFALQPDEARYPGMATIDLRRLHRGRHPGRTADQIRSGHQPDYRHGARPRSAAVDARSGRRGDRIRRREFITLLGVRRWAGRSAARGPGGLGGHVAAYSPALWPPGGSVSRHD
jgi:hypothetical protein